MKAKREAKLAEDRSKQSSLDPHLQERVECERVIPYSDDLFRQAAVEWLIATDQVPFIFIFETCHNFFNNFIISQSKLLNIQVLRIWLTLLPTLHVELRSRIARQLENISLNYLSRIWLTSEIDYWYFWINLYVTALCKYVGSIVSVGKKRKLRT